MKPTLCLLLLLATVITKAQKVPVVDGAKTPDSIPDEIAIRLFLLSAAAPASGQSVQRELQRTKLLPLALAATDERVLVHVLAGFHDVATVLESRRAEARKAPNTSPRQLHERLIALDQEMNAVSLAAFRDLTSQLSPEAAARLRAHVLVDMKRKIRIVPPPLMQK